MSYASNQDPNQQNLTTSSGTETPPAGSGAAPTTMQPSTARTPQGSGRYTNLQKYISANKGFDTGQQVANPMTQNAANIRAGIASQQGKVGEQATNISNQLNTRGTQLQQNAFKDPNSFLKYGGSNIQPGQSIIGSDGKTYTTRQLPGTQDITMRPDGTMGPSIASRIGYYDSAGNSAPTNVTFDPNGNLAEFQKLQSGGYGTDVTALGNNVNQYQTQIKNLQSQARDAGTEAGRYGLLQQRFGNPGYSIGQQRLDQLLLQSTPGAAQNLRSTFQNQADLTNNAQTGYQDYTASQQGLLTPQVKARQDAIKNLFQSGTETGVESDLNNQGIGDIEANLTSRLSQAQKDFPTQYDQTKSDLAANNASSLVPLTQGANIYNLNLADYLAPKEDVQARLAGATAQQMANPEDYARYQALQQLSGGNSQYFGNVDQSQLGKFNPITYNTEALNAKLAEDKKTTQETQSNIGKSLNESLKNLTGGTGELNGWSNDQIKNFNLSRPTPGIPKGSPKYNAIQSAQNIMNYLSQPSSSNLTTALTTGSNFSPQSMYNYMKQYGFNSNVTEPLGGYSSTLRNLFENYVPTIKELNPERLYGQGNVTAQNPTGSGVSTQ